MPLFFSSGCTWCPVQGAQQPAVGFPLLRSREVNYFNEIFLLWTRMISQALIVCQCHQAMPCWFPKMEICLHWNELLFLTFLELQPSCQHLLVIHWGVNSGIPLLFLLFVFAGDHTGRVGGDHVLCDGCPFLLQFYLLYLVDNCKYKVWWISAMQAKSRQKPRLRST